MKAHARILTLCVFSFSFAFSSVAFASTCENDCARALYHCYRNGGTEEKCEKFYNICMYDCAVTGTPR